MVTTSTSAKKKDAPSKASVASPKCAPPGGISDKNNTSDDAPVDDNDDSKKALVPPQTPDGTSLDKVYLIIMKNGVPPKRMPSHSAAKEFQTMFPDKVVTIKICEGEEEAKVYMNTTSPTSVISHASSSSSGSPVVGSSPTDEEKMNRYRARMAAKQATCAFKVKTFGNKYFTRSIFLLNYYDGSGRPVYCHKAKAFCTALQVSVEEDGVPAWLPDKYKGAIKQLYVNMHHRKLRDTSKGPTDVLTQRNKKTNTDYPVYSCVTFFDFGTSPEERSTIHEIVKHAIEGLREIMQSPYFREMYGANLSPGLWEQMKKASSHYFTDAFKARVVIDHGGELQDEFVTEDVAELSDIALGFRALPYVSANEGANSPHFHVA